MHNQIERAVVTPCENIIKLGDCSMISTKKQCIASSNDGEKES